MQVWEISIGRFTDNIGLAKYSCGLHNSAFVILPLICVHAAHACTCGHVRVHVEVCMHVWECVCTSKLK